MSATLEVGDVHFVASTREDQEAGLLGYVSFALGPLRIDGVTVRRTMEGRVALSFPARRDATGRLHPYIRPLGDRERRDLEHQVLVALGLERGAPPVIAIRGGRSPQ